VYSEASLVFLLLLSYGAIAQVFPALLAALYWRRSTAAGVLTAVSLVTAPADPDRVQAFAEA
jgi:Na+/proline symporter